MAKLYGWVGEILRVDLTDGTISSVPTANYVPRFIGGRGVGAKINWDEVPPSVGAFDPENRLVFMTGPLTGSGSPSGAYTCVSAVSPQPYPEEVYVRSMMGGHWGSELKFAGYDGVIVQGRAANPVYLWIYDGVAELRDARALWGLDTYAAQQNLWSRHGKEARIATIGPAGERLVRNAIILHGDSDSAGGGGFGAVMGSKNLKAIAVRGKRGISVARPKELLEISYQCQRLVTRKEGEVEPPSAFRQHGGRYINSHRDFAETKWADEAKKGTVRAGFSGCFSCPLCCGFSIAFKDGSNIGSGMLNCGPAPIDREEYTTHRLCDSLGVDIDSMYTPGRSSRGGWLLELVDKGVLTRENTGLPLEKLESEEFYVDLLYKVAYREGIGDLLAEDISRACHRLGGEALKVWEGRLVQAGKHSALLTNMCYVGGSFDKKGNTLGTMARMTSTVSDADGRGLMKFTAPSPQAWLAPALVPPGTDIQRRAVEAQCRKWFGSEKVMDLKTWEYKASAVRTFQDWRIMSSSIGTCRNLFPNADSSYTPDHTGDISIERRLYSAMTGIDMTEEEWMRAADRIWMLERTILTRHGHTREDDRFFDYVLEKWEWLKEPDFQRALDEYYTLRGIDVATGIPRRSKLEELDLKDIADDLKTKYGVTLPP